MNYSKHDLELAINLTARGHKPDKVFEVVEMLRDTEQQPRVNGNHGNHSPPLPPLPTLEHDLEREPETERCCEVVDEIVPEMEVHSAPMGHVWRIPVARLRAAVRGAHTHVKGSRSHAACRSAVGAVFRKRGQQKMVTLSCRSGSRFVVVTKVQP